MGDAKRFRDFSQVTVNAVFILHHRSPADHFEVGNFGQIGENLVLHAISEVSVLFIITQIFEGQHGDALFRYWKWRR